MSADNSVSAAVSRAQRLDRERQGRMSQEALDHEGDERAERAAEARAEELADQGWED